VRLTQAIVIGGEPTLLLGLHEATLDPKKRYSYVPLVTLSQCALEQMAGLAHFL
jgi:hypothetical protein